MNNKKKLKIICDWRFNDEEDELPRYEPTVGDLLELVDMVIKELERENKTDGKDTDH